MGENYDLKLVIEAQDKFSATLKDMQGEITKLKSSVKETQSTTNSAISSIKKGIAGLGLTAMVVGATKSMISLADSLEKSKIAFTTMLGSAEMAEAMLKDLSEFAQKTPFELTGIRSSAQQLLAMGVQAENIIPTLKSLGDVSAGLSVPLERLALNYGQVIAQGKLTGKELRDFTTAGVPLLEELSRMLGQSTTAIQDMISKGQITSDIMVQAFQNMTSEGGKFANLMDQQATTLSGLWSNFQDSLSSLGEEIGSELLPELKSYMKEMGAWLDDNIDNIKQLAQYVINTTVVVADNVIDLVKTAGEFVVDVLNDLQTSFNALFGFILNSDNETATGVMGDWSDVFYFFQLGFTAVVQTIKASLTSAYAIIRAFGKSIGDIVGSIGSMFSALRDDVKNGAGNMATSAANSIIDLFNSILGGIESLADDIWIVTGIKINVNKLGPVNFGGGSTGALKAQIDSLGNALKENFDEMVATVKTSVGDGMDAVMDVYANRLEKTSKQLVTETQTVKKSLQSVMGAGSGLEEIGDVITGGSSGGGKSKSSEKVEKMSEEMKNLIKEMEDYGKESEKLRKTTYEGIVDAMEEAVKKAEKLSEDIVKLKKNINDLNDSETEDIATAYIKAEATLKDYKKEYEDIVELAQEYTKEELENQQKDWSVYGFSAKDLLEVKNAYESMQSAFAGLGEEGTQALNDQIEAQKSYNDLNSVEKIKADYEAKRKVMQEELEEKMQAFERESNAFLINEMRKEDYEKKWLDYMHYSVTEQKKMTDQLITMYERLTQAKSEAGILDGNIEGRATGGPVYGSSPYIVGERGPELFVPSSNGNIIPNEEITKNNNVTINMSGITIREDADIQKLANEIVRMTKLEKNYGII